MKKSVKTISIILGISMFSFGVLKFVDPFKHWYYEQIATSDLPFPIFSYWAGQIGEIACGIAFFILVTNSHKIPSPTFRIFFIITNLSVAGMMLVAFYVHLHPNMPSDVLPLKIKPPFIPALFLIVAILNILLERKFTHKMPQ